VRFRLSARRPSRSKNIQLLPLKSQHGSLFMRNRPQARRRTSKRAGRYTLLPFSPFSPAVAHRHRACSFPAFGHAAKPRFNLPAATAATGRPGAVLPKPSDRRAYANRVASAPAPAASPCNRFSLKRLRSEGM